MKEMFRVLKKGKIAKIAVWNKNSTRFKNKKKEDFVSWRDKGKRYYYFYEEKEIKKELREAGFKIKKIVAGREFPNITLIVKK